MPNKSFADDHHIPKSATLIKKSFNSSKSHSLESQRTSTQKTSNINETNKSLDKPKKPLEKRESLNLSQNKSASKPPLAKLNKSTRKSDHKVDQPHILVVQNQPKTSRIGTAHDGCKSKDRDNSAQSSSIMGSEKSATISRHPGHSRQAQGKSNNPLEIKQFAYTPTVDSEYQNGKDRKDSIKKKRKPRRIKKIVSQRSQEGSQTSQGEPDPKAEQEITSPSKKRMVQKESFDYTPDSK